MSDIFEYDVFLSFASADEELVKPIWQEMSSSGLRVFWSDETLKQNIGQPFIEVIQNALIQSKHFVLICTENSMQSEWVKDEYQTFYGQCHIPSKRERRLILLKIKDFNISSLPPFLKSIQLSDSVENIISTLGGVNIQALKDENKRLKERIETALKEKGDLENQLKEFKSIPKRKQISAWIVILILLASILTYAVVDLKQNFKHLAKEKSKLEKHIHDLEKESLKIKLPTKKSSPPSKTTPPVHLRSYTIDSLSTDKVKMMIKQRDFFSNGLKGLENKQGKGLNHQYEVIKRRGEILVIDHATGLTWQQSGSSNKMRYDKARDYIKQLNENHFAGYDNWRLPTLEEAMSLMEPEEKKSVLYIDRVFDQTQRWIWTADKKYKDISDGYYVYAWTVNFLEGTCSTEYVKEKQKAFLSKPIPRWLFVRAVLIDYLAIKR